MKMNEIYEAPVLEVLNVMVENGFQMSVEDDNFPGTDAPSAPF